MNVKLKFDKFIQKLRDGSVLNKGISDIAPKQAPAQATPPTPAVQQAPAEYQPQYDFPPTSNDPRDEAYTRDQVKKGAKALFVKPKIKIKQAKDLNTNVKNLTSVLPSGIMGEKNYNKAVKIVEELVKNKKFQEAKDYVDGQLKELANVNNNVYAQQKLQEGGARYRPKVNKK